jgi:chromosome segregation ATPase
MDELQKIVKFLSDNVKPYATFISAFAILAGALVSAWTKIFYSRGIRVKGSPPVRPSSTTYDSTWHYAPPSPSQVAHSRVVSRIEEARRAMDEQKASAKAATISSNLLTTGQYIIGGVLASSFVQEALSPKWVGALGVLVLIASLVKQQFHPELNAADARKKAAQLKAMIRSSDDQSTILAAKIAAGQDQSDAMIALLKQITEKLNEIESGDATQTTSQPSAT